MKYKFLVSILILILLLSLNNFSNSEFIKSDNLLILNGATLIDGTDNPPISDAVVIVEGKRILKIGKVGDFTYPSSAKVLQLDNKFIIPGLIDVHTHIQSPIHIEEMKMLLAYGITSIRIPGGTNVGVQVREKVARGEMIGPKVFTGGRLIDGANGDGFEVHNEEEIRKEVRRQHAEGVNLVKFYGSMSPDLVAAGIDEAHKLGIPAIGHLRKTFWGEAIESGIDGLLHSGTGGPIGELISIESKTKLAEANNLSLEEFTEKSHSFRFLKKILGGPVEQSGQRIRELIDVNGPEVEKLTQALLNNNIMIDPTLVTIESLTFGDEVERVLSHLEPYKAPKSVRDWLWGENWETRNKYANQDNPTYLYYKPLFELGKELTLKFHQRGVILGAGSDVGMPWMTPGASLHRELELLVEAGIPVKDVLQIATKNGSRFIYNSDNVGTIEEGKIADFIILSANPLNNIKNTRKIDLVFKEGEQFNPSKIFETLKN